MGKRIENNKMLYIGRNDNEISGHSSVPMQQITANKPMDEPGLDSIRNLCCRLTAGKWRLT